ncbi:hypothetical protein [Capnocytophaga catalasegens]|uniref:Uncharacterized protein n=1 Tax=Capnocytophaga catalasegens TaxID=1004260 RepID=A0AAV5AYL3_9FLAO|nr:hypothetical protein [Capnocytophaga catalasegens]GIZ15539.1 hypothetical protein RCZ03_15390 [Capnocytophaga catalasegens]GJM49882.1 hypothetical protein RCZ15_08570 [Capnocytophaga catalasegens]GJM54054.1 hypothetical protein RCZ16_23700 [Capnocytophaga catalasegens]
MTTEQKYQAVTKAIRKALPRLVDVEKGCIVRALHNNKGVIVDIENCLGLDDIVSYGVLLPYGEIKELKYLTLSEFEIIGKEPMLNDVLEVLPKLLPPENRYYSEEIYLSSDGEFYRTYLNYKDANELEYLHHNGWDLSKPYLKDQSEDLINFLYNLLNQ